MCACVQNVSEEVVWVLTGNLRLLSSAFVGDGSAPSLIDPPTGGGGLQCSLYLFSTFGCSQTDFTLLAIRFLICFFSCIYWFAGLPVLFIGGCNDSFWFRCLYSENTIAHQHVMYIYM